MRDTGKADRVVKVGFQPYEYAAGCCGFEFAIFVPIDNAIAIMN